MKSRLYAREHILQPDHCVPSDSQSTHKFNNRHSICRMSSNTSSTATTGGHFSYNHEINWQICGNTVLQPLHNLMSKAAKPPISSKSTTSTVSIAQKCRRQQTYFKNHLGVLTKDMKNEVTRTSLIFVVCVYTRNLIVVCSPRSVSMYDYM